MKALAFAAAASLATISVPAIAQDTTTYNDEPSAGWFYGSGNDYTPANTAVLTTIDNDQLYLRMHETFQVAPASDGSGLYSFALGTDPVSFDWGITSNSLPNLQALITLTNVGTGQTFSYDPFFIGNDNAVSGNSAQNSFRLNCFGFCPGLFTPNVDSTYQVDLTVNGLNGGERNLTVFAQLGDGANAVPEPGTWAMMLLGFLTMGLALKRGRRIGYSFA